MTIREIQEKGHDILILFNNKLRIQTKVNLQVNELNDYGDSRIIKSFNFVTIRDFYITGQVYNATELIIYFDCNDEKSIQKDTSFKTLKNYLPFKKMQRLDIDKFNKLFEIDPILDVYDFYN